MIFGGRSKQADIIYEQGKEEEVDQSPAAEQREQDPDSSIEDGRASRSFSTLESPEKASNKETDNQSFSAVRAPPRTPNSK